MRPTVAVRRAVAADAYALWLWANDEETRRASHGRPPVAWSSHVAWLDAGLDAAAVLILVGQTTDGQPVGSVRFDTTDDWATCRLSYVVAAESRGLGYGRTLVEAGVRRLRDERPAAGILAEVLPTNTRSASVFRALGWVEEVEPHGTLRFWSVPKESGE